MADPAALAGPGPANAAVGLKAYLDDIQAAVRRVPTAWVRCELHRLNPTERYVRMEFIELDRNGTQVAKIAGGCWPAVWKRIDTAFNQAGVTLNEGSQVLVQLRGQVNPLYGLRVEVLDIDVTFALGDLETRIQAIRQRLQNAGLWESNRNLPRPRDFLKVAVIAPPVAAGLGDFRSSADKLEAAGLATFDYREVPFQTAAAPDMIVEELRNIYAICRSPEQRYCAVAIIRGGGASADLAWLAHEKLAEAVCKMNVPVMTGIGHEKDRNLLDEIACIPCDTPSKVIALIQSTITGAALEARHAYEEIRAIARQRVEARAAEVQALRVAIDRDAREYVRRAEELLRTEATGLQPTARSILDNLAQSLNTTLRRIELDAHETLRKSEEELRNAALALQPGAREQLQNAQVSIYHALERARSAARDRSEAAAYNVASFSTSVRVSRDRGH